MRKISHINLGNFLLECENIKAKRKSFLFGNILPDCIPTFIYVRHNIDNTLNKVEKLLTELYTMNPESYRFWIKLGCMMHYISDYFTYPHTKLFHEGFWKHNSYEKELKNKFKEHLENLENFHRNFLKTSVNIIDYIKEQQILYFTEKEKRINDVELDIQYINRVCETIFSNICQNRQIIYA